MGPGRKCGTRPVLQPSRRETCEPVVTACAHCHEVYRDKGLTRRAADGALRHLIFAESHKGGIVSDGEAEIIVRACEFADKQAEEIMIPAERVSYISLERTLEQNLDAARAHIHARLPLCAGGLDSVIGTVSMKDVWPLLDRERSNAVFERTRRPPIMIPLDYSQEDVLKAFRKGRGQIGIVRDRTGKKTLGIVTLDSLNGSSLIPDRCGKPASEASTGGIR